MEETGKEIPSKTQKRKEKTRMYRDSVRSRHDTEWSGINKDGKIKSGLHN